MIHDFVTGSTDRGHQLGGAGESMVEVYSSWLAIYPAGSIKSGYRFITRMHAGRRTGCFDGCEWFAD